MSVELGRTAYTAYGATTGGRTHDGRPMPTWDDLGDLIRAAWIAAALAASARVEHHLESIDRRLARIDRKLGVIHHEEEQHMSEIDDRLADLKAAEDTNTGKLARLIDDFENAGALTDDQRAALDALKAEIVGNSDAIDAADPEAPAPTV